MSAILEADREFDPAELRAESDHRVANSLAMTAALVRVQANAVGKGRALAPDVAQKILEEIAARIEAVAHLHRALALSPHESALEPGDYLRQICTMAQQTFDPNGRVDLTMDVAGGSPLAPERLGALGLIVNEALINAMKYAHPSGVDGQITVTCRPMFGDSLLVTIEDDGVGLPENCEFETGVGGGVGFRVMRALAGQIGAKITCRSSALGLTVQVLLKL